MKIVICLWLALFLSGLQVYAQTSNTLSGVVQDSASRSPIQGVSVTLKNSSEGTSTNAQGRFSLTTTKSNGVLVFSRVGYQSKELSFNGSTTINVVLSESAQALNDVVVIGYTQQSTKRNTASISKLNPDELRNNPNPNPVQALQGKIAGVSLPISQGQPGVGAVNIIIRGGTKPNVYGSGLGTNNGAAVGSSDGSNPLVVVDGVFRSINDINPEDIESLQVMKDAASTAIYGARGANGVIVIKTKTGRLNTKMSVNLTHRTTWETQARDYNYLNAEQYLRLARITVANTADPIDKNNLLYNGGFSAGTKIFTRKGDFGRHTYLTALYDNILQVEGQEYVDNLLSRGWRVMDDPINPGTKLLYADNRY
ncbi:MAG: carboxypeptidase-like regulatory domain-containing protein, partial [Bacteroidota bacterium]|nr:carboxypeptidase-like regulatory domain-containing protein [Bacteroidota bacterium]